MAYSVVSEVLAFSDEQKIRQLSRLLSRRARLNTASAFRCAKYSTCPPFRRNCRNASLFALYFTCKSAFHQSFATPRRDVLGTRESGKVWASSAHSFMSFISASYVHSFDTRLFTNDRKVSQSMCLDSDLIWLVLLFDSGLLLYSTIIGKWSLPFGQSKTLQEQSRAALAEHMLISIALLAAGGAATLVISPVFRIDILHSSNTAPSV